MAASLIADSAELATMTKVLDDYCAAHGVTDALAREQVAHRIVMLFRDGATSEEVLVSRLGNGHDEAA